MPLNKPRILRKLKENLCRWCGTAFTPIRTTAKFCSNACRQAHYRTERDQRHGPRCQCDPCALQRRLWTLWTKRADEVGKKLDSHLADRGLPPPSLQTVPRSRRIASVRNFIKFVGVQPLDPLSLDQLGTVACDASEDFENRRRYSIRGLDGEREPYTAPLYACQAITASEPWSFVNAWIDFQRCGCEQCSPPTHSVWTAVTVTRKCIDKGQRAA